MAAADDPVALGWALKDACYAAWNTSPRDALTSAARLADLAARDGRRELKALADWTAGIAALIEGRTGDALGCFDAAQCGFSASGDAARAAQTQVPKVVALMMLGRLDEALACAEVALAQFVAVGDERSAGKIELNIGTLLTQRDRHADAAAQYRRCAVRFARLGDVEHSVMADIGLANALTWLHEFDEALRVNARAGMRAESHGFVVLRALAHGAIGRIELNRGRYQVALRELATASRLLVEAGASPQRQLEAETALADAYLHVNLLPEAVALYDRLIAQAVAMDAPVEAAWARLQRARAHDRLGDPARALAGLGAARAAFASLSNDASVALADLGMATVRLNQGTVGSAARAQLDAGQAARAFDAAGMRGWRHEADAVFAAAAAADGQCGEACRVFERLLDEAGSIAPIALAAQRGLGALALQRGDRAEARRRLDDALKTVAHIRAVLPGDGLRSAYSAEGERAHDLLVHIDAADAPSAALFETIERGRARALAIALREGGDQPGVGAEAAHTVLRWLRGRREAAMAEGDAAAASALEREVGEQELHLLEAHRRDRLAGDTADAAADDAPPRAADVQAALAPDQAMLVYHRIGDELVAVVVRTDRVEHVVLPVAGLDERLESVRFQIETLRFGAVALRAHSTTLVNRSRAHLQALHALVWAPLAPALRGAERVVVLPHRALHYLPFCALHDGQGWLVEQHELTLAASAMAWLAGLRGPAPSYARVVALGHGGTSLPKVADEVAAVAAAFGNGATLLQGTAATQTALRALVAQADVVHLACHGQFRADSPMFSALELADGPLALHDVSTLALRASLVALSACETGLSRVAPGDELVGLVRAFLTAGARSVLASAWPVADASTAALMQGFYGLLVNGARPAAALRAVQRQLAREGEHPFHWAAFALHGRG